MFMGFVGFTAFGAFCLFLGPSGLLCIWFFFFFPPHRLRARFAMTSFRVKKPAVRWERSLLAGVGCWSYALILSIFEHTAGCNSGGKNASCSWVWLNNFFSPPQAFTSFFFFSPHHSLSLAEEPSIHCQGGLARRQRRVGYWGSAPQWWQRRICLSNRSDGCDARGQAP